MLSLIGSISLEARRLLATRRFNTLSEKANYLDQILKNIDPLHPDHSGYINTYRGYLVQLKLDYEFFLENYGKHGFKDHARDAKYVLDNLTNR